MPCSKMTRNAGLARQLNAFYVAHQLQSPAHQTVISHVLMEPPRPAVEGAQRARAWARQTQKPVLTVSDYESVISDMLDREIVWEIDPGKLSQIADHIGASPALGPTEGLPVCGTLQFSVRFANLFDEFWAGLDYERPGVIWARDWQSDEMNLIYSPTHDGCIEFLREELPVDDEYPSGIKKLSGPDPCGAWRCQWWRKYNSGYVLEVCYF